MGGIPRLLAVIGLVSCGGCAGPVISHVDDRSIVVPSYFSYYARDGEVAVEVYGAPPGVEPAGYAADVAGVLAPPFWYPPARFTPAREGGERFRMVLMFGAPTTVGGRQACNSPAGVGLWPTAAPFRVQGAMCHGGRVLTEAVGTLPAPPAGPRDPRFQALLQQLSWTLLPPERPDNGTMLRLGG